MARAGIFATNYRQLSSFPAISRANGAEKCFALGGEKIEAELFLDILYGFAGIRDNLKTRNFLEGVFSSEMGKFFI